MKFDMNTIYNIDCLEGMKQITDKSVDMVLTDIPYGEVNRKSSGLRNLDKGLADIWEINMEEFCKEVGRICKGTVYIFCGIKQISEITERLQEEGFSTRLGQWEKTNPSPMNGTKVWLSGSEFCVIGRKPKATFNRKCEKPIWRFPVGVNKIHPTQKPVKLFEYLIESSTNIGDKVFDPCMGSGTTAVACMQTGRNYLGFELNEKYYLLANERMKEVNILI
jgi:site-specific DNA-methyltransferase (adenine-specific)